jgi:hypothetical protein
MSNETDIKKLLTDDGVVAGLVGTRVYPVVLPSGFSPEDDLPAVTYATVSHREANEVPVAFRRIQVTAWGVAYGDAVELADAIIACLHRYKGGGIYAVSQQNRLDMRDPELGIYYVPVDFKVAFNTE